ncbi:hypothetical protein FQA39_LY02265 [Lamprigera yunnana]|nr:hypothetical protein FQA39_LY02265 [Lamprigera yunnana]
METNNMVTTQLLLDEEEEDEVGLVSRSNYKMASGRKKDPDTERIYNILCEELETFSSIPVPSNPIWSKLVNKYKFRLSAKGLYTRALRLIKTEVLVTKEVFSLLLWSGIMVRYFGFGAITSSSAAIESHFNHLKNRLFIEKLPLRADEFITNHVRILQDTMHLAAGLTFFTDNRGNILILYTVFQLLTRAIKIKVPDVAKIKDTPRIINKAINDVQLAKAKRQMPL